MCIHKESLMTERELFVNLLTFKKKHDAVSVQHEYESCQYLYRGNFSASVALFFVLVRRKEESETINCV